MGPAGSTSGTPNEAPLPAGRQGKVVGTNVPPTSPLGMFAVGEGCAEGFPGIS